MSIKISDIMKRRMSFSFEVFPPKDDQPMEPLLGALDALYGYKPDFISCTYGAGGSNAGRNVEVMNSIKQSGRSVPVTHFTCIGHTRETVSAQLDAYLAAGIDHVLALRGDLPAGWSDTRGDFAYATDLVRFIRERYGDRFCVAVSGSPEGHIAAKSLTADVAFLRMKQDLGADFIMTQLTYDMEQFKRWLDIIRGAGVTLPVDVGVMPALNKDACVRMCLSMNGCAIPRSLAEVISRNYNDPAAFKAAGKEYTAAQIHEYMALGVDGIHIYALNKSEDVSEIIDMAGIRA